MDACSSIGAPRSSLAPAAAPHQRRRPRGQRARRRPGYVSNTKTKHRAFLFWSPRVGWSAPPRLRGGVYRVALAARRRGQVRAAERKSTRWMWPGEPPRHTQTWADTGDTQRVEGAAADHPRYQGVSEAHVGECCPIQQVTRGKVPQQLHRTRRAVECPSHPARGPINQGYPPQCGRTVAPRGDRGAVAVGQ